MTECSICRTVVSTHGCSENILIIKNVPESTFNISDKLVDLNIFECHVCGAVQLFDIPLSEDFEAVFRSIGISSDYREHKKEQLKSIIEKYNLKNKELIEIGCGDGQFLEIFKELNVKCSGIDTSIENYKKCVDKGITTSGIGTVYDNVNENSYDAFFTFHYLEHLPEPKYFVEHLWDILKPGGIGVIEVPNYDHIEQNNIWVEFAKDHRFYYRKRTLSYLVLKCGFEIESLEENNGGICLTMIVRKPKKSSFGSMKKAMKDEVEKFKDLTQSLKQSLIGDFIGDFAVFGAGHHSTVLLNNVYEQFKIKPKRIFDSNKQKCGGKICGVTVEHKDDICKYNDFHTIIIICGIYNQEVFDSLSSVITDKNILTFGRV